MNPTVLTDQPIVQAAAGAPLYLSGFPAFASYFIASLAFIAMFAVIYSRFTPHHEFRLIRAGNNAAVPALLGALVGFALPLAAAMGGAVSLVDFSIWAVIAGVGQIIGFTLARIVMPDVSDRITAGELSAGVWLGGVAVVVGVLNAAAMTS